MMSDLAVGLLGAGGSHNCVAAADVMRISAAMPSVTGCEQHCNPTPPP
jgi:hypothetical protein